jgi:hypothetical protein
MTKNRHESIDYTKNCTVCVSFDDAGTENRLVYERPQMLIPNRPLTTADRMQIERFPDNDALTIEAKAIFSDMQIKGRIGSATTLSSIFIARSAAQALEMSL